MALQWWLCVIAIALLGSAHTQGTNVRLGNSSYPSYAGRVEIFHNGSWGTICDDDWDINDGHVICRQLGFSKALSVPCCSIFGSGSGPIWLDNVKCHGNESDVSECGEITWGAHDCNPYQHANVICRPANFTDEFQFSLAGGKVPHAGRVEVFHAGIWGDVNQVGWDLADGHVLCKGLGYKSALTVTWRSKYVFETELLSTWLKRVDCHGNESSLDQCAFVLETTRVTYGYDAGVVCKTGNETALRFRILNTTAPNAGRVEVQVAGMWGSINFYHWNIKDGDVICRQLGYVGAEMIVYGASYVFGVKPTLEWLFDMDCTGMEGSLNECNFTIDFHPNLGRAAGVVCSTNNTNNMIQLAGSPYPFAGRINVYYAGVLGTIHNRGWDMTAANVLCKELGYQAALRVILYASGPFGRGTGPTWISDLRCNGNESSIWACPRSNIFMNSWSHDYDAGVVCRTNNTVLPKMRIRLASSTRPNAGRVEISYLGVWGAISGDHFTKADGDVICRQLGYPSSLVALQYGAFGPGSGPVWLKGLRCHGSENSLTNCPIDGWSSVYPSHVSDASIVCQTDDVTTKDFEVRLIGGIWFGRVEVQYKGVWGSVVHVMKDKLTSFGHVVCTQLGYSGLVKPIWNAASLYGSGRGPVWMTHTRCHGNETSIGDCHFERNFHARYPEVGVVCNETTSTTTATASFSTMASSTGDTSLIIQFIKIGLPVLGGVLLCLVVIVCFVRYCRRERADYDPRGELMKMSNVGRSVENDDHSFAFRNEALEKGNAPAFKGLGGKDWWEIPRRHVTLGDKMASGTVRLTFKSRLQANDGSVRDCLVKLLRDPKNTDGLADLTTELKTMSCIHNHPNILSLLGACSLRGPLYLIFEYPEYGALLKYLQDHQKSYDIDDSEPGNSTCSLPRAERLRIALGVAKGMTYLSERKCIHRDLATRNIFLGKNVEAKIANIGISQDIYERQFYEKVSKGKLSARWMAPESLESINFTTKSDVWSYGTLLWEIETGGSIPYSNLTPDEILMKLKSGYRLKKPIKCSDSVYDVMSKCFHANADDRPEFQEICDWLEKLVARETAC